jgi:predicted DNA binding protein
LAKLDEPFQYREAGYFREKKRPTQLELAQELGVSAQAVQQRNDRAWEKIKRELERLDGEE